jgi:hypothetical protein
LSLNASAMLVRQSTSVPKTSNTSARTVTGRDYAIPGHALRGPCVAA